MAAETTAEAMLRKAKEQQAQNAAEEAQKKADASAAADAKVAESKKRQEEEEAAADLIARQQAAVELAARTQATGIPGVTPNAAGNPVPVAPVMAPQTAELVLDPVMQPQRGEVGIVERPWRTFQHLYANANTIMPNGKKIIFGGQNGHIGQYSTNVPDQIEHLAILANTPGSMITEVRQDKDGRYIVVTDAILEAEKQAALADSRMNTARQQNPSVAQAMNNLGQTIARES